MRKRDSETTGGLQTNLFEEPKAEPEKIERECGLPGVLLGTSSFTAEGWAGTFYPSGLKSAQYLSHYSRRFRTVEIDSTFYATPSETTVAGWNAKTPADFVIASKVPQLITHDKKLLDCRAELQEFVQRMAILGAKRGPMLFQFPKFSKSEMTQREFLARLEQLLEVKDSNSRFAVEIRNRDWLDEPFTAVLRKHNVSLALTDTTFMPRPWETKLNLDLITADFAYIRWLGDRKGIETLTTVWDKTVVDRTKDLQSWVSYCHQIVRRGVLIYAYANNHYAGHGPSTLRLFWDLWKR